MILFINIKIALVTIWRSKIRSLLTILGIVIGISSVITVVAVGDGFKKQLSDEISSLGIDIITISTERTAPLFAAEEFEAVSQENTVLSSAPIQYIPAYPSYQSEPNRKASVIASSEDIQSMINEPLAKGRFFRDNEKNVVVLGSDLAEAMFKDTSPLNKEITLVYEYIDRQSGKQKTQELTSKVIGILGLSNEESTFGLANRYAYNAIINTNDGEMLTGEKSGFDTITLKVKDTNQMAQTKNAIADILDRTRNEDEYTISTAQDIADGFGSTLNDLTQFVGAIAAISLIVGGVGVMNIMLSSVMERTKEIGIRRAIGASKKVIMLQFLVESLILSLIGGVIGIAVSFGLARLVGNTIDITPTYTPLSFILALLIALFTGIIFGIAPARRAARKKPVEALRSTQ